MAASRPNSFDTPLANWIVRTRKESVFFIRQLPKPQMTREIQSRMQTVNTVPRGDPRKERIEYANVCTGFAVVATPHVLYILTCAHILDHITKGSDQISAQQANRLLDTSVLCHHYELDYRQAGSSSGERVYSMAAIVDIDIRHDLMLLAVQHRHLSGFDGTICGRNHAVVALAVDEPNEMSRCVMVSWPSYKPCQQAEGHSSDNLRLIREISVSNPVEYTLSLLEVNIVSEHGCSGAPLLNGDGKVIALLHGGYGSDFSYFVPLNCIRDFLTTNGVI